MYFPLLSKFTIPFQQVSTRSKFFRGTLLHQKRFTKHDIINKISNIPKLQSQICNPNSLIRSFDQFYCIFQPKKYSSNFGWQQNGKLTEQPNKTTNITKEKNFFFLQVLKSIYTAVTFTNSKKEVKKKNIAKKKENKLKEWGEEENGDDYNYNYYQIDNDNSYDDDGNEEVIFSYQQGFFSLLTLNNQQRQ